MTPTILEKKTITDRLLISWIRCRRKAWLDLYEENKHKDWSAHRALQLDHQYKSFSALLSEAPNRGIEALKRGSNGVVGLRLKGIGPQGLKIEAHPPLLKKINLGSPWGDFSYIPVVAQQGRRLTREHRLSLALWSYLLEQVQQIEVKYGLAVSIRNAGSLDIQEIAITKKLTNELFDSLKRLYKDIRKDVSPGLIADRKKCTLCSWKKLCDEKANEEEDLSEISGIGAKRKIILQEIGIKNLSQLALIDKDDLTNKLSPYGESHKKIAGQLIRQAKVQKKLSPERLSSSMALPELNSAEGVFIYDIESDPDAHHDFLHGFVSLAKRKDGTWLLDDVKYQPILNLSNHTEEIAWGNIKRKLKSHPNWPVLHYGETESLSICRMAKRQGEEDKEINIIRNKFIDIHSRLKGSWVLPVNSYSLKEVAKWLKFEWSQKGSSGAKALLWWRQCQKAISQNNIKPKQLELIMRYNQDDCIATWKIAEWIIDKK
ncbi:MULTISPECIES: TM0106 family RecB-like putative nuclease [Prochlorococcus]|uniref:Predicted DNA repair enzyme, contains HhH domain and nuclease of RecB family n=1 Tax=Prochlorococcus marinus (strain SARG / CCMP1375 / SS120) TaxID=167539 RepID=Q7VDQ9_PROMA|nr:MULTISPECIES: TM0106 family RecB-like putative nuclease [Prochlorococcus]AAP99355.1 Predicted DNA repair enzyme, contains HhH domain and nuclease of RecB family [Prochlorococcus marinus subsp. marinus str. CCMP1375]KGG11374.1 DNA repair enzyme [Prochlorococcus marinus str. LG]KGG18671.1 DNA repair enzyme [Prochlorococcus marinus str. SS2]KGG22944.1 DNA repair enzyme [Prochlorococcus marinus str. SS35]KGG34048.1 DNA repair enzyme [Prochlorococcus marinus str. SS51]